VEEGTDAHSHAASLRVGRNANETKPRDLTAAVKEISQIKVLLSVVWWEAVDAQCVGGEEAERMRTQRPAHVSCARAAYPPRM
jgi:hypothetical protein